MADLRNNGVKLIILTSGTLSPLTSFISEFGMLVLYFICDCSLIHIFTFISNSVFLFNLEIFL